MKRMRDKLLWASMVILAVLFTASRAQSPSPAPNPSVQEYGGRYQLYSVGASPGNVGMLYRIDTVTGRTSVFLISERTATAPGIAYWREVMEESQAFPAK